MSDYSYTPDRLVAGSLPTYGEPGTLAAGEDVVRGQALGRITLSVGDPDYTGLVTGNGTIDFAAGPRARAALYTFECIAPAAGPAAAQFAAYRDGQILGTVSEGTEWVHEDATVTITDGTTPFDAGDLIAVEIEAGNGRLVAYDSESRDGSQVFAGISAADVDASLAAAPIPFYVTGVFNPASVVFANESDTVAGIADHARLIGIHFRNTVSAVEPVPEDEED